MTPEYVNLIAKQNKTTRPDTLFVNRQKSRWESADSQSHRPEAAAVVAPLAAWVLLG